MSVAGRLGGCAIVVTGASVGIGRATAIRLAAEGASLVLTDAPGEEETLDRVDNLGTLVEHLAHAGYGSLGEIVSLSVDGAEVRVAYVGGPDGIVLTFMERISA